MAEHKPTYEELLAQIAAIKEENRAIQQENQEIKQENSRLREVIATVNKISTAIGFNVVTMLSGEPQIDSIELARWINSRAEICRNLNASRALRAHFKKGNESLKPAIEADTRSEHQLRNKLNKINSTALLLVRARRSIKSIINKHTDTADSSLEAARAIVKQCSVDYLKPIELTDANALGRQVSQAELSPKVETAPVKTTHCECGTELIDIGTQQVERCKNLNLEINDLLNQVELNIPLSQCPKCHRVHAQLAEDAPVPVLPNQSLSQNSIVEMLNLMVNGMPLNRGESIFLKPMKLGSDTLSRIRLDWDRYYLKPLITAMLKEQKNAPVLIADETTFDCLQSQGKGISKEVEKASSQSYVLALSSPADAERPFVAYRYLRSRSAEAIGEVLNETEFKPQVLVTDGYAGYPSLIKNQMINVGHQACLIHFRREIGKAIDVEQLSHELKGLTDKELEAFFDNKLKRNDPLIKLLLVHQALGSIYRYEADNTPQENETQEQYHTRILNNRLNNVKPLMDHINTIMMHLAEEVTELRGGKYIAKKKNSYSAAVVYYMNQKEALRYFLTDPRVPCDTNIVERTIRPLTILRKNSNFAQSIEGVQSLCASLRCLKQRKSMG